VKILAQGLLDYLTLPAAGHPAGFGERIADLDRKARSNLHVALWGPAPSSFLGALIGIFFRHDASVKLLPVIAIMARSKAGLHFPLANNILRFADWRSSA
jgi:hypothetical protein